MQNSANFEPHSPKPQGFSPDNREQKQRNFNSNKRNNGFKAYKRSESTLQGVSNRGTKHSHPKSKRYHKLFESKGIARGPNESFYTEVAPISVENGAIEVAAAKPLLYGGNYSN